MPPICNAPVTAESCLAHAVLSTKRASPELKELISAFQDIPEEGTDKFYDIYNQNFAKPKNPLYRFVKYITNYFN